MTKLGQIVCVLFAACCFLTAAAVPVVTQWVLATGPEWVRFTAGDGSGRGVVFTGIFMVLCLVAAGITALVQVFG